MEYVASYASSSANHSSGWLHRILSINTHLRVQI